MSRGGKSVNERGILREGKDAGASPLAARASNSPLPRPLPAIAGRGEDVESQHHGPPFNRYVCVRYSSNAETWRLLKPRLREMRARPTPAEKALGSALRQRQVGAKFRRQHAVGPFVLDFYCSSHRLGIEVDGASHEGRHERDQERDEWLPRARICVLRISNQDVLRDIGAVVERIRSELAKPLSPPRD